jgi:hypothetical protein
MGLSTTDTIFIAAASTAVVVGVVALLTSPKFRTWILAGAGALLGLALAYLAGRTQDDDTTTEDPPDDNDKPTTTPTARRVEVERSRSDYTPDFDIVEDDGRGRSERLEEAGKGGR